MATERINRKRTVRTFSTLAEFVDYARNTPRVAGRCEHSASGSETFTGTKSLTDAFALAGGWQEGADRMEKARVAISAKVGTAARRVTTMREVGPGTLDMGRYVQGHPQSYAVIQNRQAPRKGRGKIVRLVVNISASGAIGAETLERRGAAICSLVDALEAAGRRVSVTAVMRSESTATAVVEYRWTLKAADARLNLPTLAFGLAHPSMLRRVIFRAMEAEKAHDYTDHGGYGIPANTEDKDDTGCLYLGAMIYGAPQWASVEAAQAWVRETLTAQGVALK